MGDLKLMNVHEDTVRVYTLDELHEAKLELVNRIWGEPDSKLWVLVELINGYQQAAISDGNWKFPEKAEVVRKSEALKMEVQEGDLCWDFNRAIGMEWRDGNWEDISYQQWLERHEERSEP